MQSFIICGRTTGEVELKYTGSGTAVANFTVACDRYNAKKLKEEGKQGTDFFKCVSFGKQAEYLANHLKKGKLVEVHGEVNIDQVGTGQETKFYTKVIVSKVNVLEYEKKDHVESIGEVGDFESDCEIPF